jgi:hypothetical protein
MNKTFMQKTYEKIEMLKRNPDKIGVTYTVSKDGKYGIVLGVTQLIGKRQQFLPIAILARQDEMEKLTPIPEFHEGINELFDSLSEMDDRTDPADFNSLHLEIDVKIDEYISELVMNEDDVAVAKWLDTLAD